MSALAIVGALWLTLHVVARTPVDTFCLIESIGLRVVVYVYYGFTRQPSPKPSGLKHARMSTMGIQRYDKLNRLQRVLPEGLLVDSAWLQAQGYSRQLIAKYVRHCWLSSPVRGVYRRGSATTDIHRWEPVVISLQSLLKLSLTVGGRTALELDGVTHYLSMHDKGEVHLYASEALPGWVARLPMKPEFLLHSTNLFKTATAQIERESQLRAANFAAYKWGASEWTIRISTPERAVLELLDELPMRESFHQADVLMEGLTNLRPQYMNSLLVDCRSIKTKRLFLWLAERHNHAWFKKLDIEKIDLGKGKRMIVAGGKLDTKYLITVPEEFANDRERAI